MNCFDQIYFCSFSFLSDMWDSTIFLLGQMSTEHMHNGTIHIHTVVIFHDRLVNP